MDTQELGRQGTTIDNVIHALALVVFRRKDGAVLVAPGYDPVKQERFYRPLGGHIEFQERAEAAAVREIREELGAEIEVVRQLGVVENIFTYLGRPGHELVWLFEARFTDQSLYEREVIEADEAGARFEARWVSLNAFRDRDPVGLGRAKTPLYPDGLLEMLLA